MGRERVNDWREALQSQFREEKKKKRKATQRKERVGCESKPATL